MTNSENNPLSNKSKEDEKQEVSLTETNTDVVVATSSSSSRPIPTIELGREAYGSHLLTYPPPRPQANPQRPTQAIPPSRSEAIGGKGIGGLGSGIPMGLEGGIQVGESARGSTRIPLSTPPRPTQATPPSKPEATSGKGIGGSGSDIPMGVEEGIEVGESAKGSIGIPLSTPPRPTQGTPPSRPQSTGGKDIGGRESGIPIRLGGGIQVGGSGEGSNIGTHHEVGGSSQHKRKAVEIVAPAGIEPICSICHRNFGSWKALFGHLRSHPERQWRGCFPPPVEQQPAQGDQDQLADDQAATSVVGGRDSDNQGSSATPMTIDLNQPQARRETASSSPSNKDGDSGGFDLNMSPASDDQDGGAAT